MTPKQKASVAVPQQIRTFPEALFTWNEDATVATARMVDLGIKRNELLREFNIIMENGETIFVWCDEYAYSGFGENKKFSRATYTDDAHRLTVKIVAK